MNLIFFPYRNHVFPSNMLEATGIDMALSELPDSEVIAGVQIGLIGDKFTAKPTIPEMENLQLDLLSEDIKNAILLVEGYYDFLLKYKSAWSYRCWEECCKL